MFVAIFVCFVITYDNQYYSIILLFIAGLLTQGHLLVLWQRPLQLQRLPRLQLQQILV